MLCPICSGYSEPFITQPFAPFAKSYVPSEQFSVDYVKCTTCGLIYCPEMVQWPKEKFSQLCYNEGYTSYDHDVINPNGKRQRLSWDFIRENCKPGTHLDYGGGRGYLSDILNRNGYQSTCYDPFTQYNDLKVLDKKYDLVSCIEVLEHSYNIMDVVHDLERTARDTIYVSTGFYDTVQNFNRWYYLHPRCGHILIFSRATLEELFCRVGFHIDRVTQQHKEQMNVLLKRD